MTNEMLAARYLEECPSLDRLERLCIKRFAEWLDEQHPPWFFRYQALVSACMTAGFRPDEEDDPNFGGKRTVLRPAVEPSAQRVTCGGPNVVLGAPSPPSFISEGGENTCLPPEPSEPSFAGLKLVTVVDGTVPADTIEFRASDGRVLGQIRQLATTSKAKATRITFVTGGEVPDGCLCWTSEGVLFSPAPDCPIHAERTSDG